MPLDAETVWGVVVVGIAVLGFLGVVVGLAGLWYLLRKTLNGD